jgi:hypothetical protein
MIKTFFKKLDRFLDRKWREVSSFLYYLADKKVEEEDIDWLNMHNNMIKDKKNDN